MANATLFTPLITADGNISLSIQTGDGNRLTLQHDPPYGDLQLVSDPDETWAWFNAACA